jgi:hypothetical protein
MKGAGAGLGKLSGFHVRRPVFWVSPVAAPAFGLAGMRRPPKVIRDGVCRGLSGALLAARFAASFRLSQYQTTCSTCTTLGQDFFRYCFRAPCQGPCATPRQRHRCTCSSPVRPARSVRQEHRRGTPGRLHGSFIRRGRHPAHGATFKPELHGRIRSRPGNLPGPAPRQGLI